MREKNFEKLVKKIENLYEDLNTSRIYNRDYCRINYNINIETSHYMTEIEGWSKIENKEEISDSIFGIIINYKKEEIYFNPRLGLLMCLSSFKEYEEEYFEYTRKELKSYGFLGIKNATEYISETI